MTKHLRPRVFVVQEPVKEADGGFRRAIDLSPARRFGELVFLLPPGRPPLDPEATLRVMRAKLHDYRADVDYLVTTGNPLLIAWASALAARAGGGQVTILYWQPRERSYDPINATLWA